MNPTLGSSVSPPPASKHVLVVDEQQIIRSILTSFVHSWGFTARAAADLSGACRMIVADGPFDDVICNYELPDGNAFDLVDWMHEQGLEVPTIVPYNASRAVKAPRATVTMLTKPFDPADIRDAIERPGHRGTACGTRPAGRKRSAAGGPA